MAQAPRKRRSKHRGNAAGVIEARGRTGRPPSAAEQKKADRQSARERRLNTPPTWKSSLMRAGLGAGLIFLVLLVLGGGKRSFSTKLVDAVLVSLLAIVIYAPAMYYFERWAYNRRMAKRQAALKR